MARLVSLAKAARDLGRCRHCRCAPLVIAWPGDFAILEQRRTPPPSLSDLRRAMLSLQATLFVAISSLRGGESM